MSSGPTVVGIIFPVHMWGVPRRVIAFLNALVKDPSRYYFAVAVNAGQVAATLLQLKKLMHGKGLSLSSGFEIGMPSNYIPWGGPGPKDKQIMRFTKAGEKIKAIADVVTKRGTKTGRKRPPLAEYPVYRAQQALFSPCPHDGQGLLGRREM